MYYKISNHTDLECLTKSIDNLDGVIFKKEYGMFKTVLEKIGENIDILCGNYGENRDVDKSLGGYVLLFTSTMEDELLQIVFDRYGIVEDCYEYDEIIARNSKIAWKCTCYLLSSDYGITIFKPVTITEDRCYSLRNWMNTR